MVKITHDKVQNLAENIEKGLRYLGKAMQCVDEMQGTEEYGDRMNTHEEEYERFEPRERYPYGEMGMRQGMRGTGRYSRY